MRDPAPDVQGRLTDIDGVGHYRIDGVEHMDPFLTTVVSDTNLWLFASSGGGLTAGRSDQDNAFLPYETDDRLHRAAGRSGPVTVIARTVAGQRQVWRPFGADPDPDARRVMAKSVLGDRLVMEERHKAWGLTFRVTWAPSHVYGWVRTAELVDDTGEGASVDLLDGLLDVMPAGVDASTEQIRSNLVDAYKRSETGQWGTVALYTLESRITDRAEPAEPLTATVLWSAGLASSVQLDERAVAAAVGGRDHPTTPRLTGQPGAYLLRADVEVPAGGRHTWMIVADTGLGQADVVRRIGWVGDPAGAPDLDADLRRGSDSLRSLLAGADGFQHSADPVADAHHTSNALFNSMRGGTFPYNHLVPIADLVDFLHVRDLQVHSRHADRLSELGDTIEIEALRQLVEDGEDPDLVRLVLEYLPLTFSRRHGDPSRPWNRFVVPAKDPSGAPHLTYEGNWRDIFQNWEALLQSFPAWFPNVVAKFVNASTVDGHNPYRITREGVDWEVHDPDDPWSNIGYWGDHQIVYLSRLLEAWDRFQPGAIADWMSRPVFAYADVPYTLAGHEDMVADPRNTVTFDDDRAAAVTARERRIGTDGRLVVDVEGHLVRVGLMEKLIVPALAKLSSFVPGGGIWMNTQRPEWNDANNALAGYGLSMVTLLHLNRYLQVLRGLCPADGSVPLSRPVAHWFDDVLEVLQAHAAADPLDARSRRALLDALGHAGTAHRAAVASGFDQTRLDRRATDVVRLCDVALAHLARTIAVARRDDGLVHAYQLVAFPSADEARVEALGLMLEGQVAALSSGALTPGEALDVAEATLDSDLHRADQDSLLLYPVVFPPPFLERNRVSTAVLEATFGRDAEEVVAGPLAEVLERDIDGTWRFRPGLPNAAALEDRLDHLDVPITDRAAALQVYEATFDHSRFTGRSGGMHGYEGIGSIYWHMVAKLMLAVQEQHWAAVDAGAQDAADGLARAYRRIRNGLGFRKDPATYGAFPTDCYSHTPAHAGAQQPGMTGQVKEEVLARPGELGLRVQDGRLVYQPGLLPTEEIFGADGKAISLTVCGVDVVIEPGEEDMVTFTPAEDPAQRRPGRSLSRGQFDQLIRRGGGVRSVLFTVSGT